LYEDWVWWHKGRDRQQSRIAPYLGGFILKVLICPTDQINAHTGSDPYPFSYSVNEYLFGAAELNHKTGKLTEVVRSSEKIMIIDESSQTIDDGCWAPQNYALDGHNLLSNRHDRRREQSNDKNFGRGNVGFFDGHADYIERYQTVDPRYYDVRLR
jgi:prepilin-type processing-associated H-X9-DG protein